MPMTKITKGSGNVFKDLGLPNADKLLEEWEEKHLDEQGNLKTEFLVPTNIYSDEN